MTVDNFLNKFWKYYIILEERFEGTTRYVELTEDNYSTYSIDFVNQIQTIGSEIDVIMKSMCGLNSTDRSTITKYATIILNDYPDIVSFEVKARDISYKPFDGWNAERAADSLSWWSAYNNVKHGRNENFKDANLKNVLNALMALYLLEMLYFKKIADDNEAPDTLIDASKMFYIVGWETRYIGTKKFIARIMGEI